MAAKNQIESKTIMPAPTTYICNECGKVISGDHVYIRTRRGTNLHIHNECMPKGRRPQ